SARGPLERRITLGSMVLPALSVPRPDAALIRAVPPLRRMVLWGTPWSAMTGRLVRPEAAMQQFTPVQVWECTTLAQALRHTISSRAELEPTMPGLGAAQYTTCPWRSTTLRCEVIAHPQRVAMLVPIQARA